MSKGVTIVLAGILLIAAVATGAYFGGLWTPNRVSRGEFPVQGIDVSGHQGEIQKERVPGITGFVDRNVFRGTPEEFAAFSLKPAKAGW